MDGEWVQRLVEAAWDFWWGLGDLRERLDPWSEAGPLLARLAPGKVLELAKRLRDEAKDVRRAAADALGEMGPAAATPEVLRALAERLRDEDGGGCAMRPPRPSPPGIGRACGFSGTPKAAGRSAPLRSSAPCRKGEAPGIRPHTTPAYTALPSRTPEAWSRDPLPRLRD
jgi:hypothetical protein